MSGICDTCSLSKGCRKPIGGVDSCGRYVRAKESNYQRLFGTPKRAARTLIQSSIECHSDVSYCDRCPFYGVMTCPGNLDEGDYDALLEWLRGDAQ